MIRSIRATVKKLFSDNRGEDLAECSSGLSKGAKVAITCGAILATAAGTNTLMNTSNGAVDAAGKKVVAPTGAQGGTTIESSAVYK